MAANNLPVVPNVSNVGFGTLATANTALNGTGTVLTLLTAGTNGTRLDFIKVMHLGTNVATVLRIFINNGSSQGTATNNTLIRELTIAANTISQVAQSIDTYIIDMTGYAIPANYTLLATIGTTIAAGISVTAFGGNW